MVVEDESSRSNGQDEILGGVELKRDASNQGRKRTDKKGKLGKKSFKEDK